MAENHITSRKFCSIRIRSTNPCHPFGRAERHYRVRVPPHPGRVLNMARRSAILASVFLKEELGHLGRIGCTLCLIGSLIIILHAPDTKDVKTVDEILQYAIQPGMQALVQTQVVTLSEREPPLLTAAHRFSPVLLHRPCVLARHDLLRFSSLWKNDTHRVHLDMLPSWVRFCHGY